MSCDEFRHDLHDYFLDRLPPEGRDAIEAHWPSCAACGALMQLALEMTCKDFTDFLHDYIDGRLDPERHAAFERHLSICPDCTSYLQSYRATVRLSAFALKGAMSKLAEEVPPSLIEAILQAQRDAGKK